MSVQRKETAFANLHVEFCTLDKRGAKLNQGRVKPTTTTHRFNTGIKEVNLHLQCNPDLPFEMTSMMKEMMMRMLQMVEMKTWCGVRAENSGYKAVPGVARDRSD